MKLRIMEGLVLWPEAISCVLRLALPAAGSHTSRMLPVSSAGRTDELVKVSVRSDAMAGWNRIVGQIMIVLNQEADQCFYDCLNFRIISLDLAREAAVDMNAVQDLVLAGVLVAGETEFGEMTLRINYEAVQWSASSNVEHGCRAVTPQVDTRLAAKFSKLSLMMHLAHTGWAALEGRGKGRYYASGEDKRCFVCEI